MLPASIIYELLDTLFVEYLQNNNFNSFLVSRPICQIIARESKEILGIAGIHFLYLLSMVSLC